MGVLEGKVAVVTGAGRGIGHEHALLFAREGAKVVVNDVGCDRDGGGESDVAAQVVEEIRTAGGEAVASGAAVGSFEAAEKIVGAAVEAFGRLDVMVNNAGILRDRTILKMSEAEWDDVITVHLRGTFACLQAAARVMVEQGEGGRIINTTSTSGMLGNFGQSNYGAAKSGIHALTRIAAMEFVKHGITVNALCPNAATRMTEDVPVPENTYTVEACGPQYIATVAAFLASDAAKRITGQTFGVDGDQLFAYRVLTTHGVTRRHAEGPWTIEELGQVMERVIQW
ncbi:MAG: SDR family NAD(P)-dependent oxidoreductase [Planctomycetota bacterium]|jgi:NAD(P)-dependent dehydrogenase (short-subunit alcohol dehydrogenase family)